MIDCQCACICHKQGMLGCCKNCIKETVKESVSFHDRLSKLEHFFSGKIKNPIYDAIEIHVENFNKRIVALEENYRGLFHDTKHINEQLASLVHTFVTLPAMELLVGENINNVYRTIDAIEQKIDHAQDGVEGCFERVETIEDDIHNQISPGLIGLEEKIDLHEQQLKSIRQTYICIEDQRQRIEKLERHFSGDYQLVATKLSPHKCPVCDGKAGVTHPLTGLIMPASCHVCTGKGIVWG